MKNILLLFLTIIYLGTFNSSAQQQVTPDEKLYGEIYIYPMGYDGSIYLNNEWSKGKIYLKNGESAEDVLLKFNILSNDLIFYNVLYKRLFVADKNTITAFTMNYTEPDSLFFINYNGEFQNLKIKKGDFIEVLKDGNISLWAKHTANISNSNDISTRDKIFPKDIYFIKTEKGIYETKLNTKSVIRILPNRKQDIKKLANTHKIKRKSKHSIALLIELLNMPVE